MTALPTWLNFEHSESVNNTNDDVTCISNDNDFYIPALYLSSIETIMPSAVGFQQNSL